MAKKSIEKNAVELEKLHQDYLELKLKHSSMALKETHKLSEARKDIARLKPAMNKKLEVEKSE
jgi:ribosomal protein L29